MKVILKSEVDNLGLPGDVVDVAAGYGRNFLLPRGMAILATRGAMKEADALTRSRKVRESKTLSGAGAAKEILEARTLRIAARVDERGSLYGSVSANDVQRVLKERGHDVERRRIDLKGTIKEIGTYEIPIQVHPQVTATVTVEVVDVEGKVTRAGEEPAVDVDEAAVVDVVAEGEPEPETDLEALAVQALEAAEELEQQQAEAEASESEPGDDQVEKPATDDAGTS